MTGQALFGGIDAGGTTFKCALADASGTILVRQRIPVTQPDETLAATIAFFRTACQQTEGTLQGLGIACFGPVDIDPLSPTYGTLLKTPKAGWSHTPIRAHLNDALNVPVHLDTDVNGALRAEMAQGAARGLTSAAYVTIGTGIGAGLYAHGHFIGAPTHPEFGHICVARHKDDADFPGLCAFHGDCLEGLASAPALTARFGPPQDLAPDHPAWEIEAFYLAQACISLTLTLRPQRILLGGGLMLAPGLIDKVRHAFTELMADYIPIHAEPSVHRPDSAPEDQDTGREPTVSDALNAYISLPALGDDAGLIGGLVLARKG